jgi:hypothetical protein
MGGVLGLGVDVPSDEGYVVEQEEADVVTAPMKALQVRWEGRIWDDPLPNDSPLERSRVFSGLRFTGRAAAYTEADTWYPSWASDGLCYSPWTDGMVDNFMSFSKGVLATTGAAVIKGDHPFSLDIVPIGVWRSSPDPYGGRYPCGSLVHNGTWYYGTYCLDESDRGLNWDIMGPFVGFRVSCDLGRSWSETPWSPSNPIFGESGKGDSKVRMGAPHFVDFGCNMRESPDGLAYLVGHGGSRQAAEVSWISGDEVYVARVLPSPETINEPHEYEFFGGPGADGAPNWVKHVRDSVPVVSWPGHCGCVTATWSSGLGRYLMCVTDGWPTIKEMSSYILESTDMGGPWRVAAYLRNFGAQGYFLNIPSRFMSEDGLTMWLCYSANFTNYASGTSFATDPPGSRYSMCLQEFALVSK